MPSKSRPVTATGAKTDRRLGSKGTGKPGSRKGGRCSDCVFSCCFEGQDTWDYEVDDGGSTHSETDALTPGRTNDKDNFIDLGPVRPTAPSAESTGTNALTNGEPPKMDEGKYDEIRKQCLAARKLYEDPDFPADDRSLYLGGHIFNVKWKRPGEISRHPKYIIDGVKYPDIQQGSIGNCWFIASVAALAASPQRSILSRVIPTDQGFTPAIYCGAFRFYFWRFGKWVEVIIDDRLPTLHGRLLYASNKTEPDEYWSPLLEKAYAKLKGNYHDLHGDRLNTAMVDLSGGISEMIELKSKISERQLRQILLNCQGMNSFMGGAIFLSRSNRGSREERLENGLYQGHAYSIIKIKEFRKGNTSTTLLHIRNPWAKGEWNGDWSDKSPQWRALSESDRQSTYKTEDDGEFWMNLTDFRLNFDELEMCHLTPDALTKEIADNLDRSQWHVTEHYGEWKKGVSAGGPPVSFTSYKFWSNPQFRIQLEKATRPTTVVVSLFRKREDISKPDNISIGFVVFQLKKGRKPQRITASNYYEFTPRLVATSGPYWPYRERTVRLVMDPADHVIVPCTYEPGQEAEFYLRIFAEGDIITEPIEEDTDDQSPEPNETPSVTPTEPKDPSDIAIDKAFTDIAGRDGHIDAADLMGVLRDGIQAGGERQHQGYNLETCRGLIGLSLPSSSRGMLSRSSVEKVWEDLQVWRKAFRIIDKDSSKSVDSKELKSLFEAVDVHAGTETVETVMKRYGGKDNRMSEEDFLQSFCKAMLACRLYNVLSTDKKVSLTLDEWLSTVLQL